MGDRILLNYFDRVKPFYPLVVNYVALLHGFTELAARGMATRLKQSGGPSEEELDRVEPNLRDVMTRLLKGHTTELIGPLALRSEYQGNNIKIDVDEIAREIVDNSGYLASFLMRAAGSLLIPGWETTQQFHDEAPLWEFARHCRNAAAHNGRFIFKKGEKKDELRLPAKWGKFELQSSMDGTHLFAGQDVPGLLSPGDPIRLLWDIEQAYPNMTAPNA